MRVSGSFELRKEQPQHTRTLGHKPPNQQHNNNNNKLTLTADFGLKSDAPRSPKAPINLLLKHNNLISGSREHLRPKSPPAMESQSVFQTFMDKKQSKPRSTTNGVKSSSSNKDKYMSKIYELRKKVEDLTRLNFRQKSKEKKDGAELMKSKSRSKSKPKVDKSPLSKSKTMSVSETKNKSLSTGKAKSKSKPKSKSKAKSKSKPKSRDLSEDYLMMSNEIVRVKNPEQIEHLLTDDKNLHSTDYSKFKQRSRKAKLSVLEKSLYSFLQATIYEDFIKDYNQMETMIFMVNDLSPAEQEEIYNHLQPEFEEKLSEETDVGLEDVYRGAVEILENKYETAKGVVQLTDNTNKVQHLNEWRSSKFRQILVAKNFVTYNNRTPLALENVEHEEYLSRINNELRLELDQMGQDKGSLSSRSFNPKEVPLDMLESPPISGVNEDEFDMILRAKQIREAVKVSIQHRINTQMGKIERELTPLQISTSLDGINDYLNKICAFVLQNHSEDYLVNIKKCYGLNVFTKLKNIRNGVYSLELQNQQEVLSNEIFVRFEQEVIGVGDTEEEKEGKYYEHIHNKCVFDLLNQQLSSFKPFYKNGQPLSWKYNSDFISSFLITEENMKDVIENCIYNILNEAESLSGVIVSQEVLEEYLPKGMTEPQRTLLEQVMTETMERAVKDKTTKMATEEMKATAKDGTEEMVQTRVLLDLASEVERMLMEELSHDFLF